MDKQLLMCLVLLSVSHACIGEEVLNHGDGAPVKQEHYSDGEHNAEFDHEAVLGSRATNEEFDGLTDAEAKRRLSTIIDRMDADSDETISRQELIDWVFNSFKSLDAEEAAEYFHDQDIDEDGKVTWSEYLNVNYDYNLEDSEDLDQDENSDMRQLGKMIKEDEDKFTAADLNKDGALEPDEYEAFYHPASQPYMHDIEVDRTLGDLDEDKDGRITFKEFISGEAIEDPEEELAEKENFMEYDQNGDGKLDREEIKLWVLPDHMEVAEEESQHLMSETDTDADGLLSKEEILAKFNEWVGSAATDYGLQLDDKYHDPQEL